MKKLFLPALLVLISCGGSVNTDKTLVLSNLDVDFPVTDTIQPSYIQTFENISRTSTCAVKDSIIYVSEDNNSNCGHSYNIYTGEQISTIINIGRASNEIPGLRGFLIKGDSIQLFDTYAIQSNNNPQTIKTFALNDILTKPMGERNFSSVTIPDTLFTISYLKIDGGIILGSNSAGELTNNLRYFISENNQITYFGDIMEGLVESVIVLDEKNKRLSYNPFVFTEFGCYNEKIVAVNSSIMMLEVINTVEKTVEKGKYYDKYLIKNENQGESTGCYRPSSVMCTKENIFCIAIKKSIVGNKPIFESYIFVFDWNLNPVKKYYIAGGDALNFNYILSNDCKSIYSISTNPEKQEIYEGKITV